MVTTNGKQRKWTQLFVLLLLTQTLILAVPTQLNINKHEVKCMFIPNQADTTLSQSQI